MKLELRDLAPYLPYKLDFITQSGKVFKSKTKDCFEIRILKGNSPNGNKQYHSLTLGKINRGEFKPILRPLSDLTKEINLHDDFFAIPIENMTGYKLEGNINDAPTTVQHLYGCSKGKIEAKFLDYWVIVQLLEWHFDIFGLIEKGLAINYNEIHKDNKDDLHDDTFDFNKRFMPE